MQLRSLLFMLPLLVANFAFAEQTTLVERQATCSTDADCSYHGRCSTSGQCVCDDGYITPKDGGGACSYKQKQQLAAFLLHFFLGGVGAGNWYAGQYGQAAGQLVLGLSTVGSGIAWALASGCTSTCGKIASDEESCCLTATACGCCGLSAALGAVWATTGLATFAWWLADDVLFGLNKIKDENGEKLKEW